MADIMSLLDKNYDSKFGVVNVRPIVDVLLKTSKNPFGEFSDAFNTLDARWHLPILEGMRVLAAGGHCTKEQADKIFSATETVAAESGIDEFFKSVNAVVVSPKIAPALLRYIQQWLKNDREFFRRLAFYTSGMMLERKMSSLLKGLRPELESAMDAERSPKLKSQFSDVLKQL